MIKKIRVMLEYGSYPVWLYDEEGDLVDTLLPEEIRSNKEVDYMFDDLQARYEALFIDNSYEFSFVGFKTKEEENKFLADWDAAVNELKAATKNRYEISDEINRVFRE